MSDSRLAQLVLDRLDLLAEEVVALGLGDLRPDLRLDLARQFENGQLPGQEGAELLQTRLDVRLREELLLLLDRERQAGAEEVGEPAWLPGVHRGDLQFLGDLLRLVDHPLEQAVDVVDERVELDPFLDHVFERFDPADEVGLGRRRSRSSRARKIPWQTTRVEPSGNLSILRTLPTQMVG